MLILLAQQGDREALNSLLEQIETRLFRYIRGILAGDTNDAEDVLQETLLRIARKLGWLTEPRAFESWTYRIASNEAYRALRRARRRLAEEELDDSLPAPGQIPPRLDFGELHAMLARLSPASRTVLLLHYEEEQSLEKVATILSIPLGTVKSRLAIEGGHMTRMEEIRNDVLARMDRAERNYKLAFVAAVVLEGAFLILFLMLADFRNRMHVLLLLGTVMTYSILAIGLVALGAHVNRVVLRVLQAIDDIRTV